LKGASWEAAQKGGKTEKAATAKMRNQCRKKNVGKSGGTERRKNGRQGKREKVVVDPKQRKEVASLTHRVNGKDVMVARKKKKKKSTKIPIKLTGIRRSAERASEQASVAATTQF